MSCALGRLLAFKDHLKDQLKIVSCIELKFGRKAVEKIEFSSKVYLQSVHRKCTRKRPGQRAYFMVMLAWKLKEAGRKFQAEIIP